MAHYIPQDGPTQHNIPTPLTLHALQTYVGGFVKFIELDTGDLMVVNEASFDTAPHNPTASAYAGKPAGPIFGDAVFCSPQEIA